MVNYKQLIATLPGEYSGSVRAYLYFFMGLDGRAGLSRILLEEGRNCQATLSGSMLRGNTQFFKRWKTSTKEMKEVRSIHLLHADDEEMSDCAKSRSALQGEGKPFCRPSRWWSARIRCLALLGADNSKSGV
jgi:hypothetical protein